jgi:hypothetical protein
MQIFPDRVHCYQGDLVASIEPAQSGICIFGLTYP